MVIYKLNISIFVSHIAEVCATNASQTALRAIYMLQIYVSVDAP